jgi:transposase-like protein
MTLKDDLHHLVDELGEDESREALAYLLKLRHAASRSSAGTDGHTDVDESAEDVEVGNAFEIGEAVINPAVGGTRRNPGERWTGTQIQEALRRYTETGAPVTDIFRQVAAGASASSSESRRNRVELERQPSVRAYDSTACAPAGDQRVNTRRKLSEAQEIEVTRLYAETDTPVPEIAQQFGIGESSVYRLAQLHGAALRGRGSVPAKQSQTSPTSPARYKNSGSRRKLTEPQELEVTRLYAETDTPPLEIAERFGIGESSVYRVAQRHGAALRGRSSAPRWSSDDSISRSSDPDLRPNAQA